MEPVNTYVMVMLLPVWGKEQNSYPSADEEPARRLYVCSYIIKCKY